MLQTNNQIVKWHLPLWVAIKSSRIHHRLIVRVVAKAWLDLVLGEEFPQFLAYGQEHLVSQQTRKMAMSLEQKMQKDDCGRFISNWFKNLKQAWAHLWKSESLHQLLMHWKKGPSLINFGPIDINAPALRKVCEFRWILLWPFLGSHPSTCQSFRKALLSNKWLAVQVSIWEILRTCAQVRCMVRQCYNLKWHIFSSKKQLISASRRRISWCCSWTCLQWHRVSKDAVHCDWRKILATYSGAQVRLFKRPSDSVSHGNCEDWCGNQPIE